MKHIALLAVTWVALAGLTSCATSSAPTGASDAVLNLPLASAQQAAVRALTSIGCDIQTQDATHVQGRRPNKIGLVVGSGGETVHVHLKEVSATQTSVDVVTNKSLVGIAGQKNWDEEVLAAMRR